MWFEAANYASFSLQDMIADGVEGDDSQAATAAAEPLPHFAERTVLRDAVDACGIGPLLQLPSGFGSVFLGEQLNAFISASNISAAGIASVSIKVGWSSVAYITSTVAGDQ